MPRIIPYKYNISLNLFHLPVDGILAGAHGIQCLLPQLLERQSTQLRAALNNLTRAACRELLSLYFFFRALELHVLHALGRAHERRRN